MKDEPCDLFKKIPEHLIKEVFEKSPEASAELDYTFLGFEEIYQKVAKEVPKSMIVIDFGCCYAFQSWYFKNYKKYIGVDASVQSEERFKIPKSAHYDMSIQMYVKDGYLPMNKDNVFAICSYVPDEEARKMVVENFPNHYVFYPGIIDDWRFEI